MAKKKQPKKIGYIGMTSGAVSGANAGTSIKTYPKPPTMLGGKKKKK